MSRKLVNERPKIRVDIYSKTHFMEWRLEVNGSGCKLCFVSKIKIKVSLCTICRSIGEWK